MRLDKNDTNIILSTVESIFGNVKVYLFGSRLDEQKKGGDIDLFIVSEEKSNLFEKKIKVISKLERALHKPIDIVLHKNFEREIEKEILKRSLLLENE
jgi:predicted nucleotidyltransferase